ncbi:MAG: hypothetical protein U1F09_16540 [Steroidobacteraceae bacterium]
MSRLLVRRDLLRVVERAPQRGSSPDISNTPEVALGRERSVDDRPASPGAPTRLRGTRTSFRKTCAKCGSPTTDRSTSTPGSDISIRNTPSPWWC